MDIFGKEVHLWCSFDVRKLTPLILVSPMYAKQVGMSCGIRGMPTLEFPSQILISASLRGKDEGCETILNV